MRNTIKLAIIAGLILAVIPFIDAQNVGCCCDPVIKNGSFDTQANCQALGFQFIGPPPSVGVTCSDHCNATLTQPAAGTCGDGTCQPSETTTSCPGDCAAVVTGCGSPTYKAPPGNLVIAPMPGKKAIQLSYTLPCPTDYLNISRCTGTDCTNFATLAETPPTTVYIDETDNLEFNKDYMYQVRAHYVLSGDSDPATGKGNAGDIECWGQKPNNLFCVNDFYYTQYQDYLKNFGYANTPATSFTSNFGHNVNTTFTTRLGQSWQCQANKLINPSPKTTCNVQNKEYCIADENGARCAQKENCASGHDPFGLSATTQTCELFRYCFLDKGTSTANKCYSCDPRMTCYDYKTKGGCERDNCRAGTCQWKPVFSDLGIGVCIDTRYNNCPFCNTQGTTGMDNLNAYSPVWDACREEKTNALSTQEYPCFYDADRGTSKSCDEATCADYTQLQCGSPTGGIQLEPDNSIEQGSNDICGIGVCQHQLTTGCIKNADGNTGAGFQDCSSTDKACERDYFPPSTTLVPTGAAGRVDFLNIRIFDKINKTSPPTDKAGKQGYKTYLCIQNSTTNCADASSFTISTNSTRLIIKNTVLKEGSKELAKLATGDNTITFYSRDAANNLEILKDITIYVCDECNGPTLLELNVTGGRVIGNTIYTSAKQPKFTLLFDEPTQITYADISRTGENIALTQHTTGMADKHEFTPVTEILGTYNFTISGHNDQNVYVDPPGVSYALVVDPELAGLTITPPDGSFINQTQVDISLNFTRPVTLNKIILAHDPYDDPYAVKYTEKDITQFFSTQNNYTFTAKISQISGGRNTIIVDAQGYNALNIYKQSSFYLATQKPSMRLIQPSWGVTAYSVFNISVETPLPSECKYVYNTPTAPASSDFQFFNAMEGTGYLHTASGLDIPYGATTASPLHVYCKTDAFGITQRTFNITLDSEPPIIVKAFAEPSTIAERFIPDVELYATTLKTQLNKEGFCKYSLVTSSFGAMENTFPGYDRTPKQSMAADVNVTQVASYEYWVTCKGKNELLSQPTKIPFTVDLTLPLNVSSSTPQGFGTTEFTIGVVANKRVYCYLGEQPDDTTQCMGSCASSYVQANNVSVQGPGEYTYYVRCTHISGEQSPVIEIPVLVDTTPPEMTAVNNIGIPEDPDVTWLQNRARLTATAEDPDSGISHFLITLEAQTQGRTIFKDYPSNITTGEPIIITTTANGSIFRLNANQRYLFNVKAVNRVGLESEPMEGASFLIDTTVQPEACQDGERSQNETDVDCGGECDGCEEGKRCVKDYDCATNYCEEGSCKVASCEDGATNGLESDVDCGGQACARCPKDYVCRLHTDCETNYCDIKTKLCTDAPPCADGTLSQGETDVDCGGPCEPCADGKNCQQNSDCATPTYCRPDTKTCSSEPAGDEDKDGVGDDQDACFGTPYDEAVDENGCGPSQQFSLGDSIDDRWRQDNFGCIQCPEAEANADPDKDGLTNLEEYQHKTNPTKKDTDGDWWNDKKELDAGTDPTNPDSHPRGILSTMLWVIFVLLAIAGVGYGSYILLQLTKEKKKPAPAATKEEKPAEEIKEDEIAKLKQFAKKEEIPDKDWVTLEKEIKKKPLPKKQFHAALERLRKIAHRERISEEEPLKRLRAMLEELGEEEKQDLLAKYKLFRAGLLSKEEIEELFRLLKITADYYKEHKDQLQKELETYGKRKH